VVGLGTWQLGGEWGVDFTDEVVADIFDAARETGVNLIDTAECYGDHLSERFIGKAIEPDRDRWIVATKFGHHFTGHLERDIRFDAADVARQLEGSLAALRTDYIDLYQFHSGTDEQFDNDELWTALNKLKAQGKVRHLGLSIGGNNVHQTSRAPDVGAGAIQVIYNCLQPEPEKQVLPLCREHNLGVLARVPLASGYLSGKYLPDASFPESDVRHRHRADDRRRKLEEVAKIADSQVPAGVPIARWALAWCLKHPAVTCVIPGVKNAGQVRDNAAAADLDMVQERSGS
jgi:aryl-alcohol dehydrogenase-like predicted oxidoreductase